MKKFIIGLLLFFIPVEILIFTYVLFDPFMVLRSYNSFQGTEVGLNKDYISTATFDRYYKEAHYNSFIFGNSRSVFYQVADWKKHLDPASSCYHFDASGEGLYALVQKVKYIDRKGLQLKNALLVIDHSTLAQYLPKTGHMSVISPQLVQYNNFISFHAEFIKAFMSLKFMRAYFDFKLSGQVKPYMIADNLIGNTPSENDVLTNEMRFPQFEDQIAKGVFYTEEKRKVFFKRDSIQKVASQVIARPQKLLLQEMVDVFKSQHTGLRIVINPLYDQVKLNPNDLTYLIQLFGEENVFDFSGINAFTEDYTNYYEASHYRPKVSREIMKIIYQREDSTRVVVASY